jgi:hypothetical protein
VPACGVTEIIPFVTAGVIANGTVNTELRLYMVVEG